jgi:hypothetical protein
MLPFVVIVVDGLLQFLLLMRNFVMMVVHAVHYLSLNPEPENQKDPNLFVAMDFQSMNGQKLEWRRMYMDL